MTSYEKALVKITLKIYLFRVVTTFYDNLVLFAHLLKSEVLKPECGLLASTLNWEPSEILPGTPRQFRDFRGRLFALSNEENLAIRPTRTYQDHDVPPVATEEVISPSTNLATYEISDVFFRSALTAKLYVGLFFLTLRKT